MPFDPNLPANNVQVTEAELRAQFNGLKELIDLIAPGTITAVFIDSVTTVEPSDPAAASVSLVGTELHFSFSIPRGMDGSPGDPGAPGEVSFSDLSDAVDGTSANSNSVDFLGLVADPDYNSGQLQTLFDKMDELIGVLRRGS